MVYSYLRSTRVNSVFKKWLPFKHHCLPHLYTSPFGMTKLILYRSHSLYGTTTELSDLASDHSGVKNVLRDMKGAFIFFEWFFSF